MAELRTASAMLRLRDLVVATSKTWLTARLVAMKSPLTEKASPPRATSPKGRRVFDKAIHGLSQKVGGGGKILGHQVFQQCPGTVRASVKNEKVMMAKAISGRKDKAVK